MTGSAKLWLAGLGGLALGASAMALAQQGGRQSSRADVEAIVRDYLLTHPEILPAAMQRLQARESASVVRANRAAIETPFAGAWAGNPNGRVTLVAFFDYACGYCRRANADVERLLRDNPDLKVVWRELPVLGPPSQAAAEASLAAARANRFGRFYKTLFASGRPTPDNIAHARTAAGVTGTVPETVIRAEIDKNLRLAHAIGATGTPAFVVGDQVLLGAVGYDALNAAVRRARGA